MCLDENNIKIVDIGNAGLDAKALFERGTHGVPLEKLESMIKAHKSVGELTVKKIIESKDMFISSDVYYSAVVLDTASRNKLIDMLSDRIPAGWTVIAHHMTITMGPLKDKTEIGNNVTLIASEIGLSDMAMAVKVTGYPSKNEIPHITLAINPEGGKARMSNDITKWQPLKHFVVKGVVAEIKKDASTNEQTKLKS
jgi:hypothetical protein